MVWPREVWNGVWPLYGAPANCSHKRWLASRQVMLAQFYCDHLSYDHLYVGPIAARVSTEVTFGRGDLEYVSTWSGVHSM